MDGMRTQQPGERGAGAFRFAQGHEVGHPRVPGGGGGGDPVQHELDPRRDRVEDLPGGGAAVGRGHELEPRRRRRAPDVPPQRHAVPGDERELEQRRRRPGEVPVEDADQVVADEAGVVRGDVVVPDRRRVGDREEPPRPVVREARDGFVEGAGPGHQRDDLSRGEQLGVDVDHVAGKERQDLASRRVEAAHARHVRQAGPDMLEQRVHRRGPGTGRPVHGVADADGTADVAREHFFVRGLHVLPSRSRGGRPGSWRRMRDLNPRGVAPYTLSKRAHSATMRILRGRGYRLPDGARKPRPAPRRIGAGPSRGAIL